MLHFGLLNEHAVFEPSASITQYNRARAALDQLMLGIDSPLSPSNPITLILSTPRLGHGAYLGGLNLSNTRLLSSEGNPVSLSHSFLGFANLDGADLSAASEFCTADIMGASMKNTKFPAGTDLANCGIELRFKR